MLIVRQKLSHWMAMALSSSAVALQADKLRVRRMKQLNTELLDQSLLYVFDVENKLKLLLPFTSGEEKTEFVFLRERKTPAADTFTRMVIKINQLKKPKRKLQKKKKQDVANGELDNFIQSELTIKDVVVRDSVGNVVDSFSWSTEELFSQSKGYSISIGERMYRIVSEMPMVTKLKLECHPMVGLSVYPVFSLRNGNRSDCQFYWYTKGIEEEKKSSESTSPGKHVKFGHVLRGWTLRSRSCVFVPQQEDVGRELCVVCIPSNSAGIGLPRAYLCDQPVDRAPANVLWKERHDLCQSTPIPYEVIRLLSYNILADLYLDLKLPPEELYFKYCPIEYQRCGYRISLLMSEIPGYKADLLCLQEVDLRMFDKLWAPFLSEFNLCGTYQRKGGDVAEGLATFFNRDKFSLVKCENVVLSELVAARSPGFDYIDDCLRTNDEVLNLFMSRPQVLQVTVLSCSFKEDLVIVVGNTHLHSKSFDCHIRLLQTVVCMMHLENVLASVQSSFPDKHVSVLFCGDLNSTPEMSVHKLLTTGSVHSDDVDWKRGEFPSFVGVDLAMHLKMTCLSNSSTITNVTENFSACLDYVYASDGFQLRRFFPAPPREVLFEHRGLPSASAPSDHIPLVMDVEALLDPCKS